MNKTDGRAEHTKYLLRFAASVQKHLSNTSIPNVNSLLGSTAAKHFEAREVALHRLEKLADDMLEKMESQRRLRDEEFLSKEKSLDTKYQQKERELEEKSKKLQENIESKQKELDLRRQELDDRAAKHARRQHYKEIKEKFTSWSNEFQVTAGTTSLRRFVFWPTIVLLVIFGGLAGSFLFASISENSTTQMVNSIVKSAVFTTLFVSTAFFFIRWNNQWFQKLAKEEFRLKRMELDIDRASWLVEMAFEWKDEKGENIPKEFIESLTHGLFSNFESDRPIEPADSLTQALLGASHFKLKVGDQGEVEYNRKALEKLKRERTDL